MDSILTSVKKSLGIEEDDIHFDPDIILCVNSAIMFINQLGIGPVDGFIITDKQQVWLDLISNRKDIEGVKTYIYLKTRLMFDPPTNSFLIEAIERQIKELEWRITSQMDNVTEQGGIIIG